MPNLGAERSEDSIGLGVFFGEGVSGHAMMGEELISAHIRALLDDAIRQQTIPRFRRIEPTGRGALADEIRPRRYNRDMPDHTLPPIKTDPRYGYYPWWPEDGDDWVHPEDVALAREMFPSQRIWRRIGEVEDEYVTLQYGEVRLRVKRTLWREAPYEGYELGDLVEVLPLGMANDPQTGIIRERRWNEFEGAIEYCLTLRDGTRWPMRYQAKDLKHVEHPSGSDEVQYTPQDVDGEELELMD